MTHKLGDIRANLTLNVWYNLEDVPDRPCQYTVGCYRPSTVHITLAAQAEPSALRSDSQLSYTDLTMNPISFIEIHGFKLKQDGNAGTRSHRERIYAFNPKPGWLESIIHELLLSLA